MELYSIASHSYVNEILNIPNLSIFDEIDIAKVNHRIDPEVHEISMELPM